MFPATAHSSRVFRLAPRGLSLIEMLIGMAITLVMMAAVVNLFANIGAGIRFRRAGMEMNSQLRVARARLFKDLAGATCDATPKSSKGDDERADGYLEIVEGQWSDKNPSILMDGDTGNGELDYAASLVPSGGDPQIVIDSDQSNPVRTPAPNDVTNGGGLGDYDDILALTVQSESEPFVGRGLVWDPTAGAWIDGSIESNEAEVIWYAVENTGGPGEEAGMRTVYRRALLIAPWVDLSTIAGPGGITAKEYKDFYDQYDISVRIEQPTPGTYVWVPNTLSDLVKRENRFAHLGVPPNIGVFPWAMDDRRIRHVIPGDHPLWPLGGERTGEDVMVNNVLAFDLRVFEPGAPLFQGPTGNGVLEPSDAGWVASTILGYGSFVDLGWSPIYTPPPGDPEVYFDEPHKAGWHPNHTAGFAEFPAVYDTWSFHYENDNIDQDQGKDNGAGIDQGTNGLDDDVTGGGAQNGTDDVDEREAPPPYGVPLRGIQVKLRIYEPDSRQIREATVTRNFVSE